MPRSPSLSKKNMIIHTFLKMTFYGRCNGNETRGRRFRNTEPSPDRSPCFSLRERHRCRPPVPTPAPHRPHPAQTIMTGIWSPPLMKIIPSPLSGKINSVPLCPHR